MEGRPKYICSTRARAPCTEKTRTAVFFLDRRSRDTSAVPITFVYPNVTFFRSSNESDVSASTSRSAGGPKTFERTSRR